MYLQQATAGRRVSVKVRLVSETEASANLPPSRSLHAIGRPLRVEYTATYTNNSQCKLRTLQMADEDKDKAEKLAAAKKRVGLDGQKGFWTS